MAPKQQEREPDLAPFVRASESNKSLGAQYSHALEQWIQNQVRQGIAPGHVPLRALQVMGTHPVVYLAEQTITGLIRRPNLYYVSHPDKRVVKETEEWLWPLLPAVLSVAARAFAYGSVPVVFNWGLEDLRVQVTPS